MTGGRFKGPPALPDRRPACIKKGAFPMAKKILLADDSVTIQKVVSITLSSEDYDLTIVGDGESALQKIKEERPDLVIADVAMPGRNGYDVCEVVKKDPLLKDIPVLLLSGTFEPLNEGEARRVGADDHIAKPFESQDFLGKVKALVERAGAPETGAAAPVAEAPEQAGEEPWEAGDFLGPVEEGSEEPFKLDTDFLGGVSFDEPAKEGAVEEGFVDLKLEEDKKEDTGPADLGSFEDELSLSEPAVEEPSFEVAGEPVREETPGPLTPGEPEAPPEAVSFEEETVTEGVTEKVQPAAEAQPEPPASSAEPAAPGFEIGEPEGLESWPSQTSGDTEPGPVKEEAPERAAEEEPFQPLTEGVEQRPSEPLEPSKPEEEPPPSPEGGEHGAAAQEVQEQAGQMLPREKIEEIVKKTTREVVEEIAWEVIPEMAEEFIKSEFERIREAIAKAR